MILLCLFLACFEIMNIGSMDGDSRYVIRKTINQNIRHKEQVENNINLELLKKIY